MERRRQRLTGPQLMDVVSKVSEVLNEAGDESIAALGLYIGIRVADNDGDLDEAMAWLRDVAGYGMQMVAEGRVEEARIN